MRPSLPRASVALLLAASVLLCGSLGRSAREGTLDTLVRQLEDRLVRVLDGAALRTIDLGLALQPEGQLSLRLQQTVRDLLLSRLLARGFRSVRVLPPLPQAAALRRLASRQGFEYLLELSLKLVEGHLHLRAVLCDTNRNLWLDIRQPHRGVRSHLHAVVRQDAEVRAYLGERGALPLRFAPRRLQLPGPPVRAAAVGDLNGDGASELVLLRSRQVQVLAYRGAEGGLQPRWSFALTGPLSAARPRRALGGLVVGQLARGGRAQIWARSDQHQQGVWLALEGKELVSRGNLDGFPLALVQGDAGRQLLSARLLPGLDQLSAAELLSEPASPAPAWLSALPAAFYALEAVTLPGPQGPQQLVGAVDLSGQLTLLADGQPLSLSGWPALGSALDLVDLDDDGTLELLTSGAEDPTQPDQVVVYRLVLGQAPAELWRSGPLAGRVVDLAHGDLDGDGRLEAICILNHGGKSELVVLN